MGEIRIGLILGKFPLNGIDSFQKPLERGQLLTFLQVSKYWIHKIRHIRKTRVSNDVGPVINNLS